MEFTKREARIARIIYHGVPIGFRLVCYNCDHEWTPSRCPKCKHKLADFGYWHFLATPTGRRQDSWVKLVQEIIKEVPNERGKETNPRT